MIIIIIIILKSQNALATREQRSTTLLAGYTISCAPELARLVARVRVTMSSKYAIIFIHYENVAISHIGSTFGTIRTLTNITVFKLCFFLSKIYNLYIFRTSYIFDTIKCIKCSVMRA